MPVTLGEAPAAPTVIMPIVHTLSYLLSNPETRAYVKQVSARP